MSEQSTSPLGAEWFDHVNGSKLKAAKEEGFAIGIGIAVMLLQHCRTTYANTAASKGIDPRLIEHATAILADAEAGVAALKLSNDAPAAIRTDSPVLEVHNG
ncbi:hypothetical protein [Marivivens aquimaris]|uniref:hypothetical protein n=1 Tax=Marivivens aquimaris TaxID=2774876 RepID=UPI001880B50A|nr:hypothetical protein [Marivivens aquimaris]